MKSNGITHHPSNDGTNFSDVGTEIENLRSANALTAISADAVLGTDGVLIKSDGTGRKAKATGIAVDASNNVSAIANLTRTGFDTFSEQAAPSTPASGKVVLYPKSDGRFYEKDPAGNERGLSSIGRQTIWIPAVAMLSRTTNGPSAGSVETSSNKIMLKTLDFDTTTQEFAQFQIRMPKGWDEGTVAFQAVWSHAATATNFGVVWGLEAVAISDNDAGDAAFGTAQTSTDTGGTTNNIYISPESSAITIGGTPAELDWVVFQVKRAPADGNDTLAVDARLHGISLFITTNAATDT
jgi:hypothetical protein